MLINENILKKKNTKFIKNGEYLLKNEWILNIIQNYNYDKLNVD